MTASEKLNVLNIFLDKLKTNNLVCQQDVLSLEEMLGNNIFTSSKEIVYLSPTSSCIGVDEVKKLVEKEISNVKSESHISYTTYIQTLNDIKATLKEFKQHLDNFKNIRSEVISLLQDDNFTAYYKTKDGEDGDILCYLKDDSFFDLFSSPSCQGHLKRLCYLNEEKGEEILEEFESLSRSIGGSIENYETVIFKIFNLLKEVDKTMFSSLDTSNVSINVFTLKEFLNVQSSIGEISNGVDVILNYIKILLDHDTVAMKSQEQFTNELGFFNNIINMIQDEKLGNLFQYVNILTKI